MALSRIGIVAMSHYSQVVASDARDAPAHHRGDQRLRLRRRLLPEPGRGSALRLRVRGLQRHRHRQRAHQHRARGELPATPPRRRFPLQRHAAHRAQGRRERGGTHRARLPGAARRRGRGPRHRGRRGDVRAQRFRSADDEEGVLGQSRDEQPASGHRFRGPQPAPAGQHGEPRGVHQRAQGEPQARLHGPAAHRPETGLRAARSASGR